MVPKVMQLLNNPRRLVMVVGGGVLALILVIVTCSVMGGDEAPPVVAPVDEQVRATIEAMTPTEVPTPTADVPATLAVSVEQTRTARSDNPAFSGSIFAPPDSTSETGAMAGGMPDGGPVGGVPFTRSDERFLQELGPALWYSVRLHLELEELLEENPAQILNQSGNVRAEQAAYDSSRVGRELGVLEQRWDSLSPRVRDYGRHLEETMQLSRDAARRVSDMFEIAKRGTVIDFDTLSAEDRRRVEILYWEAKDLLNSFESRIQDYGCSVCGEFYRAREAPL